MPSIMPNIMHSLLATLLTPLPSKLAPLGQYIATPRQCLIFAGIAMAVMAVALAFYPQFPHSLSRDSFEYLEFHPHRSALYPAFLDIFGGDTLYNYQPKLTLIATTQTATFILAMGFMLWGLATARLPLSVLVVFVLALVANYDLHFYHQTLLTDSFGLSAIFFLIGTLALWFHTRHYGWLASAMLVATLAFGLRPSMVAMPIGVAIVGLFHLINTRHWRKTLSALVLPFILVVGFEAGYYHAHHETRSQDLLQKHMFGRGALVLAIHEEVGDDTRLKPFMARLGEVFHYDRDRYWANGEICAWLTLHAFYEEAVYNQVEYGRLSPPSFDWGVQVFRTYPLTTARVIAQHYLKFFCVGSITLAKTPIIVNEIMHWHPHQPPSPTKRLLLQLIAWAFIALGVAFFISKIYYAYRWTKRGIALIPNHWLGKIFSRWQAPPLTPTEALGSTCIMLAFGYNLFISIFSVSIVRFLIISYPLIVLGILLMVVVIMNEIKQRIQPPPPTPKPKPNYLKPLIKTIVIGGGSLWVLKKFGEYLDGKR